MDLRIDAKFDYISRVFQKTATKKYEHYIITRIWQQLNDDDIKLVPQQYVIRNTNQYALTDIFFPQLGYHIEVNEPAHYVTKERQEEDSKRRSEIIDTTKHIVETIDCRKPIKEIHKQIDEIVKDIKVKIAEQKQKNKFNPWNPEQEFSPIFIKNKGYITTSDEVSLRTVDDICILFDVNPQKIKRGFQRIGAIGHPTDDTIQIWWPSANNKSGGWNNSINSDKTEIYESNTNEDKRNGHVWHILNAEKRTTRIVFYKYKDELGYNFYKFVGVFTIDRDKTTCENGLVWKKVAEKIELKNSN